MKAPWDIVHLDLRQKLRALERSDRGLFMVFWWRDLPLGQLSLEATRLPMSVTELAGEVLQAIAPALAAHLASDQLEPHRWYPLDQRGDPRPLLQAALALLDNVPSAPVTVATSSISVVVPTRNRPERLAACLRSLLALQDEPLEIIVVDNAPVASDEPSATREVVEAAGVRYVAEPRRGSSAARNAGVAASRGEIVAFVDDDETVHRGWLASLAAGFCDPVGLVTGLILPAELGTEAQLIFEQRYSFARGYVARTFDTELYRANRHREVPAWEIGGSGNMAIRREVFERLGGFDERLGAGRAGGCEELELFYRALATGVTCRYEPAAVTHHHHRREHEALKRQLRAYMRGHVAAALTQWANHRDPGNLRHLLWILPKAYAGYSLRCLLGDRTYRASHLVAEIAGCLSGVGYYRRFPVVGSTTQAPQTGAVAVTG